MKHGFSQMVQYEYLIQICARSGPIHIRYNQIHIQIANKKKIHIQIFIFSLPHAVQIWWGSRKDTVGLFCICRGPKHNFQKNVVGPNCKQQFHTNETYYNIILCQLLLERKARALLKTLQATSKKGFVIKEFSSTKIKVQISICVVILQNISLFMCGKLEDINYKHRHMLTVPVSCLPFSFSVQFFIIVLLVIL